MIDKEELIERIENMLTTRLVKEQFISVVERCRDVPMPKKMDLMMALAIDEECDYVDGWNDCIDAMRGEEE